MGRGRYRARMDPGALAVLRRELLAWFRRHGRDLPWRRTRDPYEILVSEVMLQQTQVERVQGYYRRFLRRYPTVRELAAARPAAVREAWEGLGYYARAANLQAAARRVVEAHGGTFPRRPEEIRALPGVGRYTAGAVASFAYEEPAPILDTNVRRVLTRLFVRRRPRSAGALDRRLWAVAEAIIPPGEVWAFNQALMDFGALLCTARAPRCPDCPIRAICAFAAKGSAGGVES